MTYFATIDAEGRATGFYTPEIHGDAIPVGAIEISAEIHAAWLADTARQRWNGEALEPCDPPPAPPVVPPPITLTNRQLFAALAITGMITQDEALAAGRAGAVPAAVDAVFASLPEQDAFLARLTWATMREVPRNHPLIAALVAADVATDQQVDAIFTLGASIP
jgi:hypothetical protein